MKKTKEAGVGPYLKNQGFKYHGGAIGFNLEETIRKALLGRDNRENAAKSFNFISKTKN